MYFALVRNICLCFLFVVNNEGVCGHTKELDAVKTRIIQVIFIRATLHRLMPWMKLPFGRNIDRTTDQPTITSDLEIRTAGSRGTAS
jgi:hypothetical protein